MAATSVSSSSVVGEGPMHVEVAGATGGTDVLVRVSAPPSTQRASVDLVCCIDVSGSMSTEATVQTADGKQESDGLSLLDLVKHAVRTVVATLQPADRLAIVAYSSEARIVTELTQMNPGGKRTTETEIEKLRPSGCTNIIDGLLSSLDLLAKAKAKPAAATSDRAHGPRVPAVLLLTDGHPNRGAETIDQHLEKLRAYAKKALGSETAPLPGLVWTFGFGYQLNSALLDRLATEGKGAFNFIPDAGFVGTVFVHALSNLLVTAVRSVRLALTPLNGAAFAEGTPSSIEVGELHNGQPRDFIVRMSAAPEPGKPFLAVQASGIGAAGNVEARAEGVVTDGSRQRDITAQRLRVSFVAAIREAMNLSPKRREDAFKEWIEEARQHAGSDPYIAAMLQDCEGQVMMALSRKEWYDRWGKHYLLSLARAHETQQANNFKDPGVQLYGGAGFSDLRDEIDDLFTKLPPPTPSVPRPPSPVSKGASASSARRRPVVDMSAYMNAYGGCFAGQCNVLMADGTERRADSIQRGDVLYGGAKVLCVVRTTCAKGTAMLVALPGGLLITPWHPVDVDGSGVWKFPHDIAPEMLRERPCAAHFTFVLDSVHHATVCGIRCVTLAHGAVGDIREHAYFGTRRVVNDLAAAPGWDSGIVDLAPAQLLRDPGTSLVRGIAIGEF